MGGWIGGTKAFKIVTKLVRVTKECTTAFRQTSTNCSSSCCNEQYVGQRFFQKKWRYIALIIVWFCSINIYFCTNQTITQLQLELACRQTYLLSMTSLLIHPYPLYYVHQKSMDRPKTKRVWMNQDVIDCPRFKHKLLFYQIEPLKNGVSLILPSSIAKKS